MSKSDPETTIIERKAIRKKYVQELKNKFNGIMEDLRKNVQLHVKQALGEVEDFMGTHCETDSPRALTLKTADHDAFYYITQNAMSVLEELQQHVDEHLGDFV